jgi:hypothetical protein
MVISADATFNNNPLITTYTLDIHFTYKKYFPESYTYVLMMY